MQLLIPFAADRSQACREVLADLALPHLQRALADLGRTTRDDAEASTLSPPHERALARLRGWHGGDGAWPLAAHAARHDGVDVGTRAWALVTPVHWIVGRDHVVCADPEGLGLDAEASRALFEAARPLFESEGFVFEWGAPLRWYLARDDLDGMASASLDRVVGRDVEPWLLADRAGGVARGLRRLQSEVQLAWHAHPVNEAREARGVPVVNSIWWSGCGREQPAGRQREPHVDARLRAPLLGEDWVAYADAWRALDAGPIASLAAEADDASRSLTLCGERAALRCEAKPRSPWRRLAARFETVSTAAVLSSL